jgi:hypothetical protein
VNPRNPRNLLGAAYLTPAAHSFDRGRIPGTFISFDGGVTWHDNGPLPLPSGYRNGSNMVVAFTAKGIGVVVVRLDNGPYRTGIFVWRTTDGGRRFSPPLALANGRDPAINVDHPWIAAAPAAASGTGAVYVVWSVTTSHRSDIAFTRSDDGGRHFAAPRLITGAAPQGDVAPVLTAGPARRVAIVYADAGAAGASTENATSFQRLPIKIVRSADAGRHFSAPQEIALATIGVVSARPMPWFGEPVAATDPRDGTLYISFVRTQPGTARPAIVLMRSRDNGRTWVALKGVPHGSLTDSMDQLQPQLAVIMDGTLVVSYFALAHARVDLYLVRSDNQGARFEPPVRVTSRSWDPTLGISIGNGQFFAGDYQGLAAGPRTIYPFWNDTRTGRLEIFTAAIPL